MVVNGATAAGVICRRGRTERGAGTTLISRGRHIGGTVSGDLSWTDVGDTRAMGGLACEFYVDALQQGLLDDGQVLAL